MSKVKVTEAWLEEKHKRLIILNFLAECTSEQVRVFKQLYSYKNLELSVDKIINEMPVEKLDWAIRQCENTVLKNRKNKKERRLLSFLFLKLLENEKF